MENLNFEPTRDWLVVPKPDKKVTDAGIILSDRSASQLRSNVLPVLAKLGIPCIFTHQVKELSLNLTTLSTLWSMNQWQFLE